jgi:hypothetical protein
MVRPKDGRLAVSWDTSLAESSNFGLPGDQKAFSIYGAELLELLKLLDAGAYNVQMLVNQHQDRTSQTFDICQRVDWTNLLT